MTSPTPNWTSLVRELLRAEAGGEPLSAQSTAQIARAVRAAIFEDVPLEAALMLPPRWRATLRRQERILATLAFPTALRGSRERARELRRSSRRYAASAFDRDRRSGTPTDLARASMFRILNANRGRVPSEPTIRNWLKVSRGF